MQIIHQDLLNIQRGSALNQLPQYTRTLLDPILQEYIVELAASNFVDQSSIMVRLAALLPPTLSSPDQSAEITTMLASHFMCFF